MYSLTSYGRMIADERRTNAYAQALQAAVRPDSVVVDIGAGAGILSMLACQYGARKVYAIEPNDAISVAKEIARANGLSSRIEFIQATSTDVTLPERADVVVSDLHGVLPLFEQHVPSIIDARRRFVSPQGVLVPQRERLWVALVHAPELYDRVVKPWATERLGFAMDAARPIVTNAWTKASVTPEQLLSDPWCWSTLDYSTVRSPDVSGNITARAVRCGTAHGLSVWFDAVLYEGIGFSNAPGQPELIYGAAFFPFPSAVELEAGDNILVFLSANLVGFEYVWRWDTHIDRSGFSQPIAHFRQSTFLGSPLSLARIRRRMNEFTPTLAEDGQIDLFILQAMNGATPLDEIARALLARFPSRFESERKALARVADLSEGYSQS